MVIIEEQSGLDAIVSAYGDDADADVTTYGEDGVFETIPEEIIARILSRLDAKKAVQTCILSTKWKKRWLEITRVSINMNGASLTKNFANFVDKLFALPSEEFFFSSPSIALPESLLLKLKKSLSENKLRVVELFPYSLTQFPFFLLSHFTLKKLRIHCTNRTRVKISSIDNIPHLQDLCLYNIAFYGLEYKEIKLNFPRLQRLEIGYCSWPLYSQVLIDAPLVYFECNCYQNRGYEIQLRGGENGAVQLSGWPVNLDVHNFKLASASLSFDSYIPELGDELEKLVNQLWKVQTFVITQRTAENLGQINFKDEPQWANVKVVRSEEHSPLTSFDILVKVGNLLKEAIYIEDCYIDLKMDSGDNCDSKDQIEAFHNCIQCNLEMIKKICVTLKGFDKRKGYMSIAWYFLHVLKVRKLVIVMEEASDIQFIREVLNAKKHSTKLQIEAEG